MEVGWRAPGRRTETHIVTAAPEPLAAPAALNVLLKALAMSWRAEGDEAGLRLGGAGPQSWPGSVGGLSAALSARA